MICSWGRSLTGAIRCPLRLSPGTADEWQARAGHPPLRDTSRGARASAAAELDALALGHLDQQVLRVPVAQLQLPLSV